MAGRGTYWWVRPVQAVECVRCVKDGIPLTKPWCVELGAVYHCLGYMARGYNPVLGYCDTVIDLVEDPFSDTRGWDADCFRPVYPPALEKLRRLTSPSPPDADALRRADEREEADAYLRARLAGPGQ